MSERGPRQRRAGNAFWLCAARLVGDEWRNGGKFCVGAPGILGRRWGADMSTYILSGCMAVERSVLTTASED